MNVRRREKEERLIKMGIDLMADTNVRRHYRMSVLTFFEVDGCSWVLEFVKV